MTDISLYRDFDSDPDSTGYDRMVHVRETPHGIFRAVVEHDDYPFAPDYEGGCPVIQVSDLHTYRAPDLETVSGADSAKHDGLPMTLPEAIGRAMHDDYGNHVRGLSDALEIVDRWLRAYHGGSLTTIRSNSYRSYDYVAYDTRAMREYWGQTGETLETSAPDATEWKAYIDGDVYVVSVERADDFYDDGEPASWETVEGPVCGHYGDDYAAEAALDMLDDEIEHTAADMLPLG